jgi:hypothetical protein
MADSDKEEARESIRHYVWSGFYSADEIAEIICEELFDPETIDKSWATAQIAAEFDKKRLDEQTWQHPTDCERLDAVFAELQQKKIITLQNAGYTQSDGLSDVTERWKDVGADKSDIIGYCFFHGQDLERAVAGDGLMLTFGDILGADEKGIVVGKTISEVLEAHGFSPDWDGTIAKRINIPNLKWRKKYSIKQPDPTPKPQGGRWMFWKK